MPAVDILKGRYVRKGAKSLPSIQIITNCVMCLAKRVRQKAMPEDAAAKPTSGIQIRGSETKSRGEEVFSRGEREGARPKEEGLDKYKKPSKGHHIDLVMRVENIGFYLTELL